MQIFKSHKSIYKLNKLIHPEEHSEEHPEGELDPYLLEIRNGVRKWQKLKKHRVSDKEIAEIIGISRASFYRRKKAIDLYGITGLERRSRRPKSFRVSKIPKEITSLILRLRKENPTYGKAKIAVILKRDHTTSLSESSVGRIIKKLLYSNKIQRSVSSVRTKRKRCFKAYAKRWQYGMKAHSPGELVQIDHMTVNKNNISMKEFRAWDPVTKTIVADIASNATSSTATKFLQKVIKDMPFTIRSIQVDGGSEFMKEFEQECQKLDIPLFILPPNRPQWNGGVERGNRTFREEFYANKDTDADSIRTFRCQLQKAVHKYNTYRPHFSLKGKTPLEYTQLILVA